MNFDNFWQLLYDHGATNTKRIECRDLWDSLSEQQQTQLFTTISTKLRENKFIHYDPLRAMHENLPRQRQCQRLSYADYYRRYGTTEETDGWHRQFLPEKQTTIYVKG